LKQILKRSKIKFFSLETFVKAIGEKYWLKGIESKNNSFFDVRFIFNQEDCIFLEVTFHPPSVERSLKIFFSWLSTRACISVEDEEGDHQVGVIIDSRAIFNTICTRSPLNHSL
jgi:hypothetical protein